MTDTRVSFSSMNNVIAAVKMHLLPQHDDHLPINKLLYDLYMRNMIQHIYTTNVDGLMNRFPTSMKEIRLMGRNDKLRCSKYPNSCAGLPLNALIAEEILSYFRCDDEDCTGICSFTLLGILECDLCKLVRRVVPSFSDIPPLHCNKCGTLSQYGRAVNVGVYDGVNFCLYNDARHEFTTNRPRDLSITVSTNLRKKRSGGLMIVIGSSLNPSANTPIALLQSYSSRFNGKFECIQINLNSPNSYQRPYLHGYIQGDCQEIASLLSSLLVPDTGLQSYYFDPELNEDLGRSKNDLLRFQRVEDLVNATVIVYKPNKKDQPDRSFLNYVKNQRDTKGRHLSFCTWEEFLKLYRIERNLMDRFRSGDIRLSQYTVNNSINLRKRKENVGQLKVYKRR